MLPAHPESDPLLAVIAAALADRGYCVLDAFLPQALVERLREDCAAGDRGFKAAGTGRAPGPAAVTAARRDEICWIDGSTEATSAWLASMHALRSGLNQRLLLGLFDYECHFARYAPGAYYRTHVDAFKGARNRILSTVFYLNPDWQQTDGGELVLYAVDRRTVLERVVPTANRLVIFLSEDFPHEVLPALRTRYSLAGWFRVKNATTWLPPE